MASAGGYYVPHGTKWPITGSIGLTLFMVGFALSLNNAPGVGNIMMIAGLAVTIYMLFGWFREVALESEGGKYNAQVDRSFRWGMSWFIFSEVMFFAAFFGTLWYTRNLSIPWLGGTDVATNQFLWPDFQTTWPSNGPGNVGGEFEKMGPWPLPFINTIILLTSGVTCTIAHHAIKVNNRKKFIGGLLATVALGFLFVGLQAVEYAHGYHELNLTLESGVYGSTFYMLTGFHGLHVCLGAIMLLVMMIRGMNGHFSDTNHFGFEAAAWYWHFVDVVWLGLFVFVYIL